MSSRIQAAALAVACLAIAGQGRRVSKKTIETEALDDSSALVKSLAALLATSQAEAFHMVGNGHTPRELVQRITPDRARIHMVQDMGAPPRVEATSEAPAQQQINSKETYDVMFKTLLTTENDLEKEVQNNYDLFDYGFLQMLDKRVKEGDDDPEIEKLKSIQKCIAKEMGFRMNQAAELLKEVFKAPNPLVMQAKITSLAREGKVDNAFLELLKANWQMALKAGPAGADKAALLAKLMTHCSEEIDKLQKPEIALIRKLMKCKDKAQRIELLTEKMSWKKASKLIVADAKGEEEKQEDQKPEVPPKLFAETLRDMKARFGNVDEDFNTGFMEKIEIIAEEAEKVAWDLSGGKELTPQQQQDYMWNKGTVSVWDLAAMEDKAHEEGNLAVWEQEAQEQMARQENQQRKEGALKDFNL